MGRVAAAAATRKQGSGNVGQPLAGLSDGQGFTREVSAEPQQRGQSMLANTKYIYALDMWTVEKRPTGWYFSKSAYHGDRHDWRGPYSSKTSVTLMIARELRAISRALQE
jgi:hypothetical protein